MASGCDCCRGQLDLERGGAAAQRKGQPSARSAAAVRPPAARGKAARTSRHAALFAALVTQTVLPALVYTGSAGIYRQSTSCCKWHLKVWGHGSAHNGQQASAWGEEGSIAHFIGGTLRLRVLGTRNRMHSGYVHCHLHCYWQRGCNAHARAAPGAVRWAADCRRCQAAHASIGTRVLSTP